MGIMQPLINDDRFVYTDVAVNRDPSRLEPSIIKLSCCYVKQKREKCLRFYRTSFKSLPSFFFKSRYQIFFCTRE